MQSQLESDRISVSAHFCPFTYFRCSFGFGHKVSPHFRYSAETNRPTAETHRKWRRASAAVRTDYNQPRPWAQSVTVAVSDGQCQITTWDNPKPAGGRHSAQQELINITTSPRQAQCHSPWWQVSDCRALLWLWRLTSSSQWSLPAVHGSEVLTSSPVVVVSYRFIVTLEVSYA